MDRECWGSFGAAPSGELAPSQDRGQGSNNPLQTATTARRCEAAAQGHTANPQGCPRCKPRSDGVQTFRGERWSLNHSDLGCSLSSKQRRKIAPNFTKEKGISCGRFPGAMLEAQQETQGLLFPVPVMWVTLATSRENGTDNEEAGRPGPPPVPTPTPRVTLSPGTAGALTPLPRSAPAPSCQGRRQVSSRSRGSPQGQGRGRGWDVSGAGGGPRRVWRARVSPRAARPAPGTPSPPSPAGRARTPAPPGTPPPPPRPPRGACGHTLAQP